MVRVMKQALVRFFLGSALFSAAALLQTPGALADTLFGAMEKAYVTNPTLDAARAGQRAVDELVPQALSGWRPTVAVQGNVERFTSTTKGEAVDITGDTEDFLVTDNGTSAEIAIQLNQPVFRGFGTVERTKGAEARVDASRQNLLETEQQVLFNVVQAYMSVYAGRQFVSLRKQDVAALQAQVKASQERFAVGEITRTDVAQSEARLAESQSALVDAQTQLARDVAFYVQVVGNEPGKLNYPKVVKIPSSLKAALAMASEINPRLLAQSFVELAANSDIGVAFSNLLPTADVTATGFATDPYITEKNSREFSSASVAASLTVPLYEAGLVYSQVREAKQRASQSRIQVIEIARDIRRAVASSWNSYVGLAQIIKNTKTQVNAAQLALNGVQQEYQAGTRTTLDVLNAQRELVFAQVLQVRAERDRVIAGYQLLAAIGHLTARDVGLNVAIYDPEANYSRVRNKWIGTDVKTVE